MTGPPWTDLEETIRVALRERATSFHPVRRAPGGDIALARHRTFSVGYRVALLVAGITIAASLGAVVWVLSADSTRVRVATEGGPRKSQGPAAAGREIRLRIAPTPESIKTGFRDLNRGLVPGTQATTLRPGRRPSVTVSTRLDPTDQKSRRCLNVELPARPPTAWNVTETCETGPSDQPPTRLEQIFYYPHADSQADSTVNYVWTQVPAGTAYVTFASSRLRAWERPVHGIVVFPVDDGPTAGVARAFDAEDQPLGAVSVGRSRNGARVAPTTSRPGPKHSARLVRPGRDASVV